jgi:hypothetical protein
MQQSLGAEMQMFAKASWWGRSVQKACEVAMDDVVRKLTAKQALEVVLRLHRKGGTRDAVVTEAMDVLAEIELDDVAEDVFVALDAIDVEDCWARSGPSRDVYRSPDEAAAELVEEELRPFLEQIERYHDLGMADQEAT